MMTDDVLHPPAGIEDEEVPAPLETVDDRSLSLLDAVAVTDGTDGAATEALELDMLTALVWAPPALARRVVEAIAGSAALRESAGGGDDSVILGGAVFWRPAHQLVFDTIRELLDEGSPATATLVQARIADNGQMNRLKGVLLELAAPRYRRPVVDGSDLPHLAAEVVTAWYRRGYGALLTRMAQCVTERPSAELAGHWASLTGHQLTAERRWLAVRDALARAH